MCTIMDAIVFLYWESEVSMQCSSCGVSSAKRRGRITALNRLPMFLLIQLRMWLASFSVRARCLLIFVVFSPSITWSFLAKLPFRLTVPGLYCCTTGSLQLITRTSHFLSLIFTRYHLSSQSRPWLPTYSTLYFLNTVHKIAETLFCTIIFVVKTLISIGTHITP